MPSAREEPPAVQGTDMKQRRSNLIAAFLAPAPTAGNADPWRPAAPASRDGCMPAQIQQVQ
jgi:hypothetical protein